MAETIDIQEPIYTTQEGQTVTKSQLIASGYDEGRIGKGVQNGVLKLVGDTQNPTQSFKTKDGQQVTTQQLLQSGYTQDRIDKGVHEGILLPSFVEKKNQVESSNGSIPNVDITQGGTNQNTNQGFWGTGTFLDKTDSNNNLQVKPTDIFGRRKESPNAKFNTPSDYDPELDQTNFKFNRQKYNQVIQGNLENGTPLPKQLTSPALYKGAGEETSALNPNAEAPKVKAKRESIENTVNKKLVSIGITPNDTRYDSEKQILTSKYKKQLENGDLSIGLDENGELGLRKKLGVIDSYLKGYNDERNAGFDAANFQKLTPEQKVNHTPLQEDNGELLSPKKESFGSFLGSTQASLEKPVAGTIAAAGLTTTGQLEGLPTVAGIAFSSQDAYNKAYQNEFKRIVPLLKQEHPDWNDTQIGEEADKQAKVGGGIGMASNAILFGGSTGLGSKLANTVLDKSGSEVIGKALTGTLKMAGVPAAGEALTEEIGNLNGEKTSQSDILNNSIQTFKENLTPALVLHGLGAVKEMPNAIRNSFKYAVKDIPPTEIRTELKGQEDAGLIPKGEADKTADEIQSFHAALNKIPEDLSDDKKLELSPLIEKKNQLQQSQDDLKSERSIKDDAFKPEYDKKIEEHQSQIDDLNNQINEIVNKKETGVTVTEPDNKNEPIEVGSQNGVTVTPPLNQPEPITIQPSGEIETQQPQTHETNAEADSENKQGEQPTEETQPPKPPTTETVPAATESEGSDQVGVHHAALTELAEKYGLPEVEAGQSLTREEYAERGRLFLAKGASIDEIDNKNNDLHDRISIGRAYIEKLDKELNDLRRDGKSGTDEYKNKEKELASLLPKVKELGNLFHQAGISLQGTRDSETDNFITAKRNLEDRQDKPLDKTQSKKLQTLTDENANLKSKIDELNKKVIEKADSSAPSKEKSITQKAKEFADKIRKAKIHKPDTFSAATPASLVWDGAVETVAKSIEAGGKIADAIQEGIKYIQGTDWYKQLSEDKQKNAERDFTKWHNDKLNNTPEEKELNKLRNRLDKLENGDLSSKNKSQLDFTDEQKKEHEELKSKIKTLEEDLGLREKPKPIKSSQLKESDSDNNLPELQKQFENKKGNKFTPEESKAIRDYAKKTYTSKGVSYIDAVGNTAKDLGLSIRQTSEAMITPETKKLSDELWRKQYEYQKGQRAVSQYIETQNQNPIAKLWKKITAVPRALVTAFHGHIFAGTHYPMGLVTPSQWRIYFKAIGKMWTSAYGSTAKYEQGVRDLLNDKNYTIARRAGLENDPIHTSMDDYERSGKVLGNFGKTAARIGETGTRGFFGLKWMRQAMFNRYWDRLPKEEQTPEAAKSLAWLMNNATGATNLKIPSAIQEGMFSAGMEAARWGRVVRNPAEATARATRLLSDMAKGKEIKPEDKVFAKVWFSRVAQQLATMGGILFLNAAIQKKMNPKNPVNLTDPSQPDFFKLKADNTDIDISGGNIGVKNLLTALAGYAQKDKSYSQEKGDIGGKLLQYGRGKLSPAYGDIAEVPLGTDYNGNILPWSDKKVPDGKRKIGWGEYFTSKAAPIFVQDAMKNIMDNAEENGIPKSTTEKWVNGLIESGLNFGMGIHSNPSYEKPTPFTDEDYKDPTFNYFSKKWGMELPNTSPKSEEITDEENGTKMKLSEYPKAFQDKYIQQHKENLKDALSEIRDNGLVYIKKYKDASGNEVSQVSLNPPEKGDYDEKDLDGLNEDEKKQVLRLAQDKATEKTKKDLFNQ